MNLHIVIFSFYQHEEDIEKSFYYKKKIIFIFLFPLLLIEIYRCHKLKQIKVCICTIGKQENRYIKEYIEYYKKYRIDKIFLYDNNNLNDEHFENILEKYKNENFVEIKNWRGIRSPQMKMYQDCYKNNYEKFEWLIFNDIDEYLYLKSYNNVKEFLSKKQFKNCSNIQLNWLLYTDNNLMHYQNEPLNIRFKEKDPYFNKRKISKFTNGKSILRGHIPNINITNFHCISKDLKTCDGFGIVRNFLKPNYKYYYFRHYYCKSTEEFIDKLKKGDVYKMKNINKINFIFLIIKLQLKK